MDSPAQCWAVRGLKYSPGTESALTRPAGGQEGVERGRVTTEIYSPTTNKFLGMAYVPAHRRWVGGRATT